MKNLYSLLFIFSGRLFGFAQENSSFSLSEVHGNIQTDAYYYNPDSSIGATPVPEKMLMNGFANIIFTKGNFSAGLRYESYLNTLQGFDPRYKGNGVPYRFASYKADELEVTAGNFYEQFGSGLVLRAYEEKGLGIDNAFDGFRLKYVIRGLYLKGLIGKQRSFFTQGPGIVRGFDGELHLNELFAKWKEMSFQVSLGGSFVSKYQSGDNVVYQTHILKVPQNVGASSGRISVSSKKVNFIAEYAYKINDPSAINNYLYRPGHALFLSTNYSTKGFAVSAGTRYTDNFSFKNDRTATGNNLDINFLPALARQHTYSLFAFYPYATQPNGEVAHRIEINKKFRKETKLGGKYGTDITIHFSNAYGLDTTTLIPSEDSVRYGYKVNFFSMGQLYYYDFHVELQKKFSPKLKLLLLYSSQAYNKNVIQGLTGYETIFSNIAMAEATYKFGEEKSIRWEVQHLATRQDDKNWAQTLLELGLNEHWLISGQDMYNYGNEKAEKRIHYYNVTLTYIKNAMRVSMGYGRQRAGIFCVGGVCRYVPASNGIILSVTSSF